MPVLELRAAIPLGCALGLPPLQTYLAAVIGNMLPVPFIILFVRRVFAFIRRKWPKLNGFVDRLEQRALKNRSRVQRFEVLGLALFVAIPLPGTGAWTGSLLAALMNFSLKRALPTVLLGVLVAGVLMTLISYGVLFGVSAIG